MGRKKKKENEKWEKRALEMRRENEVWGLINRERKKRINKKIEMENWKKYFMSLLGGVEKRMIMGSGKNRGGRRKKRLKDEKVIRGNRIPGEAWKYGVEALEEWLWSFCNGIWRGKA